MLPKMIYRFNAIPIKISVAFFKQKKKKTIPKFVWNHERLQKAKPILRKNKPGGIFPVSNILQNYSNQNSIWY